jgi:hypothetical protein
MNMTIRCSEQVRLPVSSKFVDLFLVYPLFLAYRKQEQLQGSLKCHRPCQFRHAWHANFDVEYDGILLRLKILWPPRPRVLQTTFSPLHFITPSVISAPYGRYGC